MRVLVTGGSGFIGTNLIDLLISKGFSVLNLDVVKPRCSNHSIYFKYCDINDIYILKNFVQEFKPDIFIHLAARTDLNGSSLEDYTANTKGVENVCIVLSQSCSFVKRVIFASSMLVCEPGYFPNDDFDFSPSTVYGESKVQSELTIRKFLPQIPFAIIVRPTSIWGPWFSEPYKNFFDVVLKRRFFNLSSGFCTKTYGFVLNTVNQLFSLISENSFDSGKVLYLGDSLPIQISDWAFEIAYQANVSPPIQLPYFAFKSAAFIGDFLSLINTRFPINSFRLNNMLTDNVIDCSSVVSINKFQEISRVDGTKITLEWINSDNK